MPKYTATFRRYEKGYGDGLGLPQTKEFEASDIADVEVQASRWWGVHGEVTVAESTASALNVPVSDPTSTPPPPVVPTPPLAGGQGV